MTPEDMKQYTILIAQFGFPIFITLILLFRWEKVLQRWADAAHQIVEQNKNLEMFCDSVLDAMEKQTELLRKYHDLMKELVLRIQLQRRDE